MRRSNPSKGDHMSKQVVAEVIALIELGMIAPEDIVKCLRKANSEPEQALAAQPAVPDAFGTREGEHPQYIEGWNDCRAETLKMRKP